MLSAIASASGCAEDEPELEGTTQPAIPDGGSIAPADAAWSSDTSVSPPDATTSQGMLPDASARYDAALAPQAGATDASAPADASTADSGAVMSSMCSVQPIPESLRTSYRMGAIYKRFADANGVPVIASEKPSDEAIRRPCPTLYAILKEVLPDKPSFRDCYYYE